MTSRASLTCQIPAHLFSLRERLRGAAADSDGQSLVETAASLTVILCIVFTVIAGSEAAYAKHFVSSAARLGTRYAIVRGSTFSGTACNGAGYNCQASASDIQTYVRAATPPGLSAANVQVTTVWPGLAASGLNCLTLNGATSPGCDVQVKVSYNFTYHLPFVTSSALVFQSTSSMPILQ